MVAHLIPFGRFSCPSTDDTSAIIAAGRTHFFPDALPAGGWVGTDVHGRLFPRVGEPLQRVHSPQFALNVQLFSEGHIITERVEKATFLCRPPAGRGENLDIRLYGLTFFLCFFIYL
jgi:hypothetical protein